MFLGALGTAVCQMLANNTKILLVESELKDLLQSCLM